MTSLIEHTATPLPPLLYPRGECGGAVCVITEASLENRIVWVSSRPILAHYRYYSRSSWWKSDKEPVLDEANRIYYKLRMPWVMRFNRLTTATDLSR